MAAVALNEFVGGPWDGVRGDFRDPVIEVRGVEYPHTVEVDLCDGTMIVVDCKRPEIYVMGEYRLMLVMCGMSLDFAYVWKGES